MNFATKYGNKMSQYQIEVKQNITKQSKKKQKKQQFKKKKK